MTLQDKYVLLSWGIATLLAWLITGTGYYISLLPSTVLKIWIFLMAIPIILTVLKYYRNNSNNLFNLWAAIIALFIIQNVLDGGLPVFSYFTLWFIVGTVGYYYTSGKLPPPSDKIYLYGAAANLAAIPFVYLISLSYVAFLAALIQAGPILYDYWAIHR